jgi:hypothetical protein
MTDKRKVVITTEEMRTHLHDGEYAIIVDSQGTFSGVLAPNAFSDFDELPKPISDILTYLYGDIFNITYDRKMH